MNWNKPQKVLVVDDAAINRQVLGDLLKGDHTVILAKSGEQALERAFQHLPDLILLDVVMPEIDGYEVLSRLKADARTSAITVIFITGLVAPGDEARGLTLGASDYITKPFNLDVVKARVKVHLQVARQRRMLETLANVDGLTEIPNRRYFDERYSVEWARAARSRAPLSVAVLDIDYFKDYNDQAGHAMGDRVLQDVAHTLVHEMSRPADLVARYGGEEFALVMPETDASGGQVLAERARAAIEALVTTGLDGQTHRITVSIGGATTRPGSLETATDLFKAADEQLYRAKQAGRNRVSWRV